MIGPRNRDGWAGICDERHAIRGCWADANGRLELVCAEPENGGQVRPYLWGVGGPVDRLSSDLDAFAALRLDRRRPGR